MEKTITEWQIMFTMTSGLEDFYTEDEAEYNEKFQDLIDNGDLQYVEQCIRKDYVWNEELEDWEEDWVEILYDAENYDDYVDTPRVSVKDEYKYKATSYFDLKYAGVEDVFYANDWSEVEDFAHEHLMKGSAVEILNTITGKEIKLNPDEYNETFDGEFILRPEELEEAKETNTIKVKWSEHRDYGDFRADIIQGELEDGRQFLSGDVDDIQVYKKGYNAIKRLNDKANTDNEDEIDKIEKEMANNEDDVPQQELDQINNQIYNQIYNIKEAKELSDKWKEKMGNNVHNFPEYEFRALRYAEIYGIVDYEVKDNIMTYIEELPYEGTFEHKINLDTMEQISAEQIGPGYMENKEEDDEDIPTYKEAIKSYNTTDYGYHNNSTTVYGELLDGNWFVYIPDNEALDIYDTAITDKFIDTMYNYDDIDAEDDVRDDEWYDNFQKEHNITNKYDKEKLDNLEVELNSRYFNMPAKVEESKKIEERYNIYTISEDGYNIYNSHKVDTVDTLEQAEDRVSELNAETGMNAYYEKVDEWWETNSKRLIDYVNQETPEAIADLVYNGNIDEYMDNTSKQIALDIYNQLGKEETEKLLNDFEIKNLSDKETAERFNKDLDGLKDTLTDLKNTLKTESKNTNRQLQQNYKKSLERELDKVQNEIGNARPGDIAGLEDRRDFLMNKIDQLDSDLSRKEESKLQENIADKFKVKIQDKYKDIDLSKLNLDSLYNKIMLSAIKDTEFGYRDTMPENSITEDSMWDVCVGMYADEILKVFKDLGQYEKHNDIDSTELDVRFMEIFINSLIDYIVEHNVQLIDTDIPSHMYISESKLTESESAYCYELYDNENNKVDDDYFTDFDTAVQRAKDYLKENPNINYVEIGKLIWYDEQDYEDYKECDDMQIIKTITRSKLTNESKLTEGTEKDLVPTGLSDPKAKDILNSVIGQMSDGIWENTSQMNRYWQYANIVEQNGELFIKADRSSYGSGFYGKSDEEVRKFFANKVKQIVKVYIDDYGRYGTNLKWDRNCTEECGYLDYNAGVTIQDAYRVYDKLLGRIDRIKTESLTSAQKREAQKIKEYAELKGKSLDDEEFEKDVREFLGLTPNEYAKLVKSLKTESKKEEQAHKGLQEEVEKNIDDAIYTYLTTKGYETDESAKEFMKDYVVVKTWYEDMTSESSSEIMERYLAVEVRAELDFEELSTLSSDLDIVVQKYDASSYFDFITGGIIRAYIQVDSNEPDEIEEYDDETDWSAEEESDALDRFEQRYMSGGNGFTANKKNEDYARTDLEDTSGWNPQKLKVSLNSARETLQELDDLMNITLSNLYYAPGLSEEFLDELEQFEDGPLDKEYDRIEKAIKDTETKEIDNSKKPIKKSTKKKTEAVNIEDEKEKVNNDIQSTGTEDVIDTENELVDGIKKEIYQYTKQQGLDLEKLRKQGVELETISDTIDKVVGDMVSKSAIEFMDQTGQEINWDFEIKDNDIHIVWGNQ